MKQQINSLSVSVAVLIGAFTLLFGATLVQNVHSMSLDQAGLDKAQPVTLAVIENPELVARVLDSLLRSIIYSSSMDLQSTQV